jgi:hypothetical protein
VGALAIRGINCKEVSARFRGKVESRGYALRKALNLVQVFAGGPGFDDAGFARLLLLCRLLFSDSLGSKHAAGRRMISKG